ncbi:LysM peptidoglycan-binding domain-containing protein [Rhodanobacter lindaniclasticus]
MDHSVRFPCLFVVAALLAGCGTMRSSVVIEPAAGSYSSPAAVPASRVARTPIPGGSYVVAKGDTLYSIAFRNGVDFRDLAQWNAIAVPYTIWPGQRLTLSPPAAAKVAPHAPAPVGSSRAPSVVASAPVFEPVTASTPAPSATVAARPHAQAAPAHPHRMHRRLRRTRCPWPGFPSRRRPRRHRSPNRWLPAPRARSAG